MDQSKNINPNTGQRSNITLDVNANFDSDAPSITINDITDDTITFTTGTSISSGVYLSYAFTDECNGLSAVATVSSWCHNTQPIFATKTIDLYTRTLYTLNVVTGTVTNSTGKGTITTVGDRDSTFVTPGGVSLVGNVFIVPGTVTITGDATIVSVTTDTITIQTNNTFTTGSVSISYSLVNECGVIRNQTFTGTMTPFLPENFVRSTRWHGEWSAVLSLTTTINSTTMNGFSFAVVGGGTTANRCDNGESITSLTTNIDGAVTAATSIFFRTFIFRNNQLFWKGVSDSQITSFLSENFNTDDQSGFRPIPDNSFWNNLLDISSGYTPFTSAVLTDTVTCDKRGECNGHLEGFLISYRYT